MPVRPGASERHFKLSLIAPSIFVLLLIGVFPLVYLLVVSFQGITMTNNDPSFHGLRNFALLFNDTRLWESLLHTLAFTAIALPLELLLGLLMWAVNTVAATLTCGLSALVVAPFISLMGSVAYWP